MAEAAQQDAKIVDQLNHEPFHRGEMPINEQTSTYHFFDKLWRWGGLGVADFVLFLAITFCTGAGALTALITCAIVFAAGFFILRKPTSLETH